MAEVADANRGHLPGLLSRLPSPALHLIGFLGNSVLTIPVAADGAFHIYLVFPLLVQCVMLLLLYRRLRVPPYPSGVRWALSCSLAWSFACSLSWVILFPGHWPAPAFRHDRILHPMAADDVPLCLRPRRAGDNKPPAGNPPLGTSTDSHRGRQTC